MSVIRYFNRFPEIIIGGNAGTAAATERAGNNIETRAKGYSRVDTGVMRNGWQQDVIGQFERIVYNTIHYTVHNEYGTVNMSAQPMLRPAVEETLPEFIEDVGEAWGR